MILSFDRKLPRSEKSGEEGDKSLKFAPWFLSAFLPVRHVNDTIIHQSTSCFP
jgi:hypothetical protein